MWTLNPTRCEFCTHYKSGLCTLTNEKVAGLEEGCEYFEKGERE